VNLPFLGEIAPDLGDMPQTVTAHLIGQNKSWIDINCLGLEAGKLKLNWRIGF
jgi:predicted transcriptional regulator